MIKQLLLNSAVSNHVAYHGIALAFGRIANLSVASLLLLASLSVQAAPTVTNADPAAGTATLTPNAVLAPNNVTQITPPNTVSDTASNTLTTTAPNPTAIAKPATNISDTLAAQLQPSNKALSAANQELLSRNAQLQRQVNDLQTQVNVLVYESKGQLFLYGALTVLMSLLVGIFISWLVFVRRERW